MISESHFLKLAQLLTVGDICTPFLYKFDINESTEVVFEGFGELCFEGGLDPMEQIALATKDGETEGLVYYEMLYTEKKFSECLTEIKPDAIMSSSTSLINAVRAFSNSSHPVFLILHEKWFKGWLTYKNLHTPAFRYCLLAMLITLEQTILDTILSFPNESIKCLTDGRLTKAKELYIIRKYNYNDKNETFPSKLLECTTFIDKFSILRKLIKTGVIKAIPVLEDKEFCRVAEKLRNEIAHPGLEEQSSELLSRKMLWHFIDWLNELELALISINDYEYDQDGNKAMCI